MTLENNGKAKVEQQEWHALKPEEVLSHLRVEGNGLSTEEAKKRLDYYGPNQLKEAPRPTFLQQLWEQLNNFVVILLIVASVISALLGDYVEAAAIMARLLKREIRPRAAYVHPPLLLAPQATGTADLPLRSVHERAAEMKAGGHYHPFQSGPDAAGVPADHRNRGPAHGEPA